MHPRHRSPGNGYRSNQMGFGMGSRVSPENSGRPHGFYNSEYRNFNRSFGRNHSQPKSFQPPPPPPPPPQPPAVAPLRKGDVFMEAGRLAAEYLVAQGVLPPGSLGGKWQNGSFKDSQEYKSQEGDTAHNMQFSGDSRSSSFGRFGDSGSDAGPGRRRYSDDYGSSGYRNYAKGRRRGGSFRGYNSEWDRDYGRSGSWSDHRRGSPGLDADHEYESGYHEEQFVTKNDGTSKEKASSEGRKSEESLPAQEPESKLQESRATSSDTEKEVQDVIDGGGGGAVGDGGVGEAATGSDGPGGDVPLNKPDELSISKEHTDELKADIPGDMETGKGNIVEELPGNKPSEKFSVADLQSLCKFANMSTRTRSVRGPRMTEEEKISGAGTSHLAGVVKEDDKAVDDIISELAGPELETSKAGTFQAAEAANLVDNSLIPAGNQELSEKRGEKRVIEEIDTNVDGKRLREWLPAMDSEVAGSPTNDEKPLMVDEVNQESARSNAETSKIGEEPDAREKQLLPGSFKICDLNLMETSDAHENRDRDPIFMFPPVTDQKEVGPVDIDLSISNSSMSSQLVNKVDDADRAIEVIDLDEDSAPEDREFEIPERKPDVAFPGLDGFSANSVQNAADIPDNQDGFGLMISELLASDFTGCSSVPAEINPLDNMGLNGAPGPLGDDDSIYMSLGEIPFLSFMRSWEPPPPQEDGKPF